LAQWGGFLAGWPGLPNNEQHETWVARILYGLNFIIKLPPVVALDMLTSIITYSISEGTPLLQSVTPLFGEPSSFEYQRNEDRVGDVAAKLEAKRMIQASAVTQDLPVAFDTDNNNKKKNNMILSETPTEPNVPLETFQ
jgi:lycopene beta-cyclase